MKVLLIVDAQNDFITGSLAAKDGKEVVKKIVDFLNKNKDYNVYYTLDYHNKTNKSFKVNGGIWPIHCQKNTWGSKIEESFYKLKNKKHLPSEENMFYKGIKDYPEEYSAYESKRKDGKLLKDILKDSEIYVIGFVYEYCVLNTLKDLVKNNYNAKIIRKLSAVIDDKNAKDLTNKLLKKDLVK